LEDRTLLNAGDLDPTFGSGGKVLTSLGTNPGCQSVAIQSDGRIVAAGATLSGGFDQFALTRYNSNGSLDTSFGSGGIVTTSFGAMDADVNSVAVQSDGKIVVAGFSNAAWALARYNSNGSLDTSFGSGGKVTTSFGGYLDAANSVVEQSDGRIVVAGYTQDLSFENGRFALARYNSNGSLDTSFGSGGKVTTSFGSGTDNLAAGVVLQSDGRIVAAGSSRTTAQRFALARYNTNGSLDTSFGSGGLVTTAFAGQDAGASGVAVAPDGRIIAAGSADNGNNSRFALARYNSNGGLDTSFGSGGTVTTGFSSNPQDTATSVAVQLDGRILAAGSNLNGSSNRFGLARYNSNGSLDTLFGSGGLVTTSFAGTGSNAAAVAVQRDGRIVVAGTAYNDINSQFGLARYQGSVVHLSVNAPSTVTAGTPFNVTVSAIDEHGSAALYYTGAVTLTSTDPAAPTLGSHTFTASDRGTFTFTGLRLFTAGARTTRASDGSLSAQADLTVTPGAAASLVLGAPSGATAGVGFDVSVTTRDSWGNVATGYTGTVTLTSTDPQAGTLDSHTFTSSDAGVYTFSGLQLFTSGPQSIVASDGTLSAQANVTVNPGVAASLVLSAPASTTAGATFSVTVTAYDTWGNVATGYTGTVSLTSTDPQAPTLGSYTFTSSDAGVYTFTGLQLFTAGPQSIFANDGTLSVEADLTVNADVAAFLVLTGPSSATAGEAFTVTVTAYDAYGNVATGYLGTVTFACDDPAAILPADYPFQPEDQGVQSFQVTLGTLGMTWHLTVTDTSNSSLTASLDITV
jgi:uncharacterized delta-60 repeat protein